MELLERDIACNFALSGAMSKNAYTLTGLYAKTVDMLKLRF